jgi:endo-1,4-beta-xylanase
MAAMGPDTGDFRHDSGVTRRRFLTGLAAAGLAGAAPGCGSKSGGSSALPTAPSATSPAADPRPLRQIAQSFGREFGAAVEPATLAADSAFASAVTAECGMVTSENCLKWAALRPAADRFDFTRGDALRDFARAGGMVLRGHTLVWHNSLPSWFSSTVNAGNAERYLVEHIAAVASHYAGEIHSWDVVNEAIDTTSGRADGLRYTPWLQFLGPRYLDVAFATAAAADPRALLTYNEYGLELSSSGARRSATLRLLSDLRMRGVPIHALGIQGHAGGTGWAQFDAGAFAAFLRDVAALGLRIFISELDVKDNDLIADTTTRDQQVAATYRDYLSVALAEPAVGAVITWGLSDKYTWIKTTAPRSDGLPVRPLPLDSEMKRKPAWEAIAAAFRGPSAAGSHVAMIDPAAPVVLPIHTDTAAGVRHAPRSVGAPAEGRQTPFRVRDERRR